MNRKDFIKGSCGVCIALSSGFIMSTLLESCNTSLSVVKTSSKNDVVSIALTEFEKGDYKLVRVSDYDYDLAIQKYPDGTYKTLVMKCSHAGQPLTRTGKNYYCALHGSQFDHEGHVKKGPAEADMMQLTTSVTDGHLIIHLKNNS